MCGIIAYKGPKDAAKIIVKGLKTLEYRGYDSWGIGIKNNTIKVIKKVGKIGQVSVERLDLPASNIGIGHTRWATHGNVTEQNAHPHLSEDNKIAVVHNGIVENYQELRDFLVKRNVRFKSNTDTEVIPQYISFLIKQGMNFELAVKETLNKIEGSFAIVAVKDDENTLIGARRGSPLVLGLGEDEFFIASDVPAFLEHTKNVIYLDDNEVVVINNGYKILGLKDYKEIKKHIHNIPWSLEQAKKDNYPHYMLKEIHEQKFTIKKAIEQPAELIEKVINLIKQSKGIFLVGCGTSYHACVSSSYTFAHIAKRHVNVTIASEFRNYEEFLTDKTLVIAVSQSGETADLLDAVKTAKKRNCRIISICNVMGSTLTRLADENIMMNSGPEICVLSTKTYTAQLAILLLLAYCTASKTEKAKNLINEAGEAVSSIIEENHEKLKELAKKLKKNNDFFLIGRDLAYPSALEGALKIKEVSYIHAEGFAGGELKHGTIALIEEGTPVIVLTTKWTKQLILSNAMELKSRGAFIIGVNEKDNELYDCFIKVPELGNANPITMIISIQLLSYYLALERECDPDKPRNLAKSVTVK